MAGIGPIDGGQVAIGSDGRLHVAWFQQSPMRFYYARSDDAGDFEAQQVLSVKDEGNVESGPTGRRGRVAPQEPCGGRQ